MEPKYSFGRQIYIKKGFYRGYVGEIRAYEEVKTKNQKTEEEETIILYTIKIRDVPLKDPYLIREDWIIPYRKYWIV